MRNLFLTLLISLFVGAFVSAQVKIGDNPQNIDPSSVLELESTDKVLVITRVTTAQMNAIVPSQGALCFNTDLQSVHYYDGTQWVNIGGGGTGGPLTADPIVNTQPTIVITPTATGDNLEVAPNSIRSEQIVDGGINGVDIQDGSIGQGKLQDNSVTQEKLSENSVGAFALDNDNIGVSAFNNDVGYITAGDITSISADAGNAITAGSDGGAYYDDTNLLMDVMDNAADIAADNDQSPANEIQNPTLTGTVLGLTNTAGTVDLGPLISAGGSDDQNIGPVTLDASNVLSIGIEDGMPATVDLSSLAGTGSTEVVDGTTLTGVGTAVDPFKIEPSATNGQFLSTNATGAVAWADLPPAGGASLFDPTTISGTGALGDEYTVADDAISTIKIIDGNVTPIKIEPSATNGQFLSTDATGAVAWADLPPSAGAALFDATTISGSGTLGDEYTVADDAISTIKIIDGNVTPIKIEPSATNGQFLSTDATGAVAWADLPPSGGAALFDPTTISGTGSLGDEYTVADDGITTAKILDANVTTAKIAPAPDLTPAVDQMLITTDAGVVEWAPLTPHTGTAKSIFFADTDGTPTTTDDNGNPDDDRGFFWDTDARQLGAQSFGALFIGLEPGNAQSNAAKVHIADNFPGVAYALQLQNNSATVTGRTTGMLFATEGTGSYGKGALVYEYQDTWARGDFHFLQRSDFGPGTDDNPDLTHRAFTIKNNSDIVLYGGIDVDGTGPGTGLGTAGQVLSSTGTGVQWINAGGSAITLAGDVTGLSSATQIATGAVNSDKILNGAIATEDVADDAITAAKIASDAAGAGLTQNVTTGALEIADDAITTNKILDGTIALTDLSDMGASDGQVLKWNNTTMVWEPAADNTAGASVTDTDANDALTDFNATTGYNVNVDNTSIEIASDALQIRDGGVTSAKIADATITPADLSDMGASDGQVLKWNNTTMVWEPGADNNNGHSGTAAGSVFFSGAGPGFAPTENNAQLFWDNTNTKLYIGPQIATAADVKLNVGGTIRSQGIKNSQGSAGTPSYRFTDDLDTGLYSLTADQLGISTGGTEALRIDANQNVGVGTTTPNSTLQTGGSFAADIQTSISNLTLNNTHHTVILGGNHNITLPVASTCRGRLYIIKNTTVFNPTISSFMDSMGNPTTTIATGGVIQLQSDGTTWQQIN